MKISSLLLPTMKENPAHVTDPGLTSMIRRGYASFSSDGNRLSLLPMGVMIRGRLHDFLREKLMNMSFQPVSSSLAYDGGLSIARGVIQSYRHLPFILFEEKNSEILLAGYSHDFYTAEEELKNFWEKMEILVTGLGIQLFSWKDVSVSGQRYVLGVRSDKGYYRSEKGLACSDSNCSWRGTAESFIPFTEYPNPSPGEMKEVHTPGIKTIADLCSFMDIQPFKCVKTMLFVPSPDEGSIIAVLVRGDRNVNETKLAAHLGVPDIRPATSREIADSIGNVEGFLGPAGLPENILIVADKSVEGASDVIIGANKKDFHLRGACWGRDFRVHSMADLSSLESGDKCPKCGRELKDTYFTRFCDLYLKVGPKSRIEDLTYLDGSNEPAPVAFWKGTVHTESLLTALFRVESSLPGSIVPFHALVTIPSMKNAEAVELAQQIEKDLEKNGLSVLVDDREMRGGVKFADAEILDLPFTIVVGRGASEGKVELWLGEGKREEVDLDLALEIITKGS